ncbi:MAG: RluA family pseudouridine synthase [Chitinophagia bacterium]|nr:RluA family pseudouridine synthase [Chitinophagia bacterium]
MKLTVIYEDDNLIAINKPANITVIPDRFNTELPSVNKLLEKQVGYPVRVVHRLDRDTTGVLCFAKNEEAHQAVSGLFLNRQVTKLYAGLVHGKVNPSEGRIENHLTEHPHIKGKMIVAKKGKLSVTDYKVAKQWPLYALLQMQLHTGRTHQIRVHTQFMGNPIVADVLYGDGKPFFVSTIKKKYALSLKDEEEKPLLSRLALHAYSTTLHFPGGKDIKIDAPMPKDMLACINQLDKWSKSYL